jgi:hypothetical protein
LERWFGFSRLDSPPQVFTFFAIKIFFRIIGNNNKFFFRPELLSFDSLSKENKKENLQLCFDVAQRDLGIDPLLDVVDIADSERPDESAFFIYFF